MIERASLGALVIVLAGILPVMVLTTAMQPRVLRTRRTPLSLPPQEQTTGLGEARHAD
jgi:hypothetical protein